LAEIRALAERLQPLLAAILSDAFTVNVVACASQIGSGALPLDTLPSAGLGISARNSGGLERLAAAFRALPCPVIGRIEDGMLILDLRCLNDEARFHAAIVALGPAS
jgi:L-seryl-tRNA(Ser) seleniumtransferase